MSRVINCGKVLFAVVVSALFAVLCLAILPAPQANAYSTSPTVDILIENNDGLGGTDGAKTYDGQEMALIAELYAGSCNMNYQWYRQSGTEFVLLEETSDILTIKNVSDSGNYRCDIYEFGTKVCESEVINISITPKNITCNIFPKESVYGESAANLSYWLGEEPVAGDNLGIALYKEEGNDAGTYDIFGGWNNINYYFNFENGADAYTISPRNITCEINPASSFYGEPLAALGYTVISGSLVTDPGITLSTAAFAGADADAYGIEASYTDTNNYQITFSNNHSDSYTVEKRPVAVVIEYAQSVYGETTVEPGYRIVSGTMFSDDTLNITMDIPGFPGGGAMPLAGQYIVQGSPVCSANYQITILNQGSFLYTVSKRPLTVAISSYDITYGDATPVFGFGLSDGTMANGETAADLQVLLLCEDPVTHITYTKAGAYPIVGEYYNDNYEVSFENGVYTINKKPLSISFDNYEGLIYNSNPQDITVEISGVIHADNVILHVEGNGYEDAGTYEIRVLGFSNVNDFGDNYTLPTSGVTQTYTIAPRTLGIEFRDVFDSVYNGTERLPYAQPISFIYGDSVTLDYAYLIDAHSAQTVEEVIQAGNYRIKVIAILGADKDNYLLPADVEDEFVISPAPVTYTAYNASSEYGEELSALSGTVIGGTIFGDDDLGVSLWIADYNGRVSASPYAITGAAANTNYDVTFVNGSYTVTPKAVTFVYAGAGSNRIYNKSEFQIFISVEGLVPGDKVSYDPASVILLMGGAPAGFTASEYYITLADNAGAYILTVSGMMGEDADNYSLTVAPDEFTIARREVTLQVRGDIAKVYDGLPLVLGVVAGNICEDVTLSISGIGEAGAGTHVMTVNAVENPNYKLPLLHSYTYRIEKAKPVITVGATSYTFPYNENKYYSIDISATYNQTIYIIGQDNDLPFVNYFSFAKTYQMLLVTKESDNFAASDPVSVRVVVMDTRFWVGNDYANDSVAIENGANPDAKLESGLVKDRSRVESLFKPENFSEKVSYIYYAALKLNGTPVSNTGRATITFNLPSAFKNLAEVRIIYMKNGIYVQEALTVTDGSITFTADELGYFAIIEDKDLTPRVMSNANFGMAIAISATLVVLAMILAIVLAMVTRSKYNLTMYKPQNRVYAKKGSADTLPHNNKGWYKDNTLTKPFGRNGMPAKDVILYSGLDASDIWG